MKKKLISFITVLTILMSFAAPFASADATVIVLDLQSGGSNTVYVESGDIITVQYFIQPQTATSLFTTSNEVYIDTDFFELVYQPNGNPAKAASGYTAKYIPRGDETWYMYFNTSTEKSYGTEPVEIGSFQLKVIADSGSTDVTSNRYVFTKYESGKLLRHTIELKNLHVVINSQDVEWEYEKPSFDSLVYSGEGQGFKPVVLGESLPEGTHVEYSTSKDGPYTAELPQAPTNAGTYTLWFRVSAPGYTPVIDSYDMTIAKKPASIVLGKNGKEIGENDPESYAYSLEGFVSSSDLSGLQFTREAGEELGDYKISVSYTENPNYEITVTGETCFHIGEASYQIEYIPTYAAGHSLVLVYCDADAPNFTLDGFTMYDVSASGYKLPLSETKEQSFRHCYAAVIPYSEQTTLESLGKSVKAVYDYYSPAQVVSCTGCDLNNTGKTDMADVVAGIAVLNGKETYFTSYGMIVLRADVNASKSVTAEDIAQIKAIYRESVTGS